MDGGPGKSGAEELDMLSIRTYTHEGKSIILGMEESGEEY